MKKSLSNPIPFTLNPKPLLKIGEAAEMLVNQSDNTDINSGLNIGANFTTTGIASPTNGLAVP